MKENKNQRKIGRMILFLFFVCCMVPVFKNYSLTVHAAETKVRMNKSSVTIEKGKNMVLKLKGVKKDSTIRWMVKGKAAAVVKEKGSSCRIIGVEEGKAEVLAGVDGRIYTCKVKVKLPPPVLSEKTIQIRYGERACLVLENAKKPVKWSVKDPEMIETRLIHQYCIMIGKRAGTTYVKAQTGGKTYRCKVIVSESGKPEFIVKNIAVTAGHTVRLFIRNTGYKSVKWGTENPEIASVDESGTVKANKAGVTRIFAMTGGRKVYARIEVFEKTAAAQ